MRVAPPIELSAEQRTTLEAWANGRTSQVRVAKRNRIVLLAAEGKQNLEIAATLSISVQRVARWRCRSLAKVFLGSEKDAPRPGRLPLIAPDKVAEVIRLTTLETPAHATHWSTRSMAKQMGISDTSVLRIWRSHGLKPHRSATFKASNDPLFAEKFEVDIGLYLSSPEHGIVLRVDEKSRVQVLDRTQPGLPLKRGRADTMTQDYKCYGSTTLFAAMDAPTGRVISLCQQRHRHREWLKFLRLIDEASPQDKQIHLIADNYATHKYAKVQRWLRRHPRFHVHFTPASASCLDMVERFFRDLTENRLKRVVVRSVLELIEALDGYVDHQYAEPKPFIWTARAQDIVAKVMRAQDTLNKRQTV